MFMQASKFAGPCGRGSVVIMDSDPADFAGVPDWRQEYRRAHGFHLRKLPISVRPSRWLFSG